MYLTLEIKRAIDLLKSKTITRDFVKLNVIADEMGVTYEMAAQVVAPLTRSGYLERKKGPNGGIRRTRVPVTALDVYKAFDYKIPYDARSSTAAYIQNKIIDFLQSQLL